MVYRTLDLTVLYVQARRILCEFCREPFTYILGDRKNFNVTGIPIVSNDDGMRKEAMKKAADGLAKISRSRNQGAALCPFCKRYQSFMVSQSRTVGFGCGFLGGIACAGSAAMLAGIWLAWPAETVFAVTGGGALLGLAVGKKWALDSAPHLNQEDGRSKRDDEIPSFLDRCRKEGYGRRRSCSKDSSRRSAPQKRSRRNGSSGREGFSPFAISATSFPVIGD